MKTLLLTLVLLSGGFTFAEEEQKIPVQETPSPAIVHYDVTTALRPLGDANRVGPISVIYRYNASRDKIIIMQQSGHKESASSRGYFNRFYLGIKDKHTDNIIYRTELTREEYIEKIRLFDDASSRHPVRIEFDTEAEEILSITVTRPEF